MPRRKFGKLKGKNLKCRTRLFLQRLGFSSFDPKPLISQVNQSDMKIKYPTDYDQFEMDFKKLSIPTIPSGNEQFEYIQINLSRYNFVFILYISEKKVWRAYVPTKGNSFCKKKKKVHGFCGCHVNDIEKYSFHPGETKDDIFKRFKVGGVIDDEDTIMVKNPSVRKGPPTKIWGEEINLGDAFESSPGQKMCVRNFDRIGLVRDLAWNILDFCDQPEIFKYQRVCKLWNHIIVSEHFQKLRWMRFSKKKREVDLEARKSKSSVWNGSQEYYFGCNSVETQNFMCFPNYFTLDVDGSFESMFFRKKESTSNDKNYYLTLNYNHSLAQYFCRGFRSGDLPGMMRRSIPFPVLIDLSQEYERIRIQEKNKEFFENYETLIDQFDHSDFGCVNNDLPFEDIVVNVYSQKGYYSTYTLAKQFISKMLRTETEIEYFDHDLKSKKVREFDWTQDILSERQEPISVFLKEFASREYENSKNLERLINTIRNQVQNLTIYRTSDTSSEECGILWIVGERNRFLIGVSVIVHYYA